MDRSVLQRPGVHTSRAPALLQMDVLSAGALMKMKGGGGSSGPVLLQLLWRT